MAALMCARTPRVWLYLPPHPWCTSESAEWLFQSKHGTPYSLIYSLHFFPKPVYSKPLVQLGTS